MLNPADYTSPLLPTVQDVLDVVNQRRPEGIAHTIQARLLDKNLLPQPLPAPLDPNDPTALCSQKNGSWVKDVTPSLNEKDMVQRSCKFRLYEFPGLNQFNTLNTYIRIYNQYWRTTGEGDPELLLDIPQGTYMFSIPDRTLLDSENFWDITGHGSLQRVKDCGFENDFVPPAGANVVETVRRMLMMDEFPPDEGGRQPTNVPTIAGNCVGCLPGSSTGTEGGYCQQGYPVTDPSSGTGPVMAMTSLRQRTATGFGSTIVYYSTVIGMKLDAPSGAPIDPYNCLPMAVQIINPGAVGSMVPGEFVPGEGEPGDSGDLSESPFPAFIFSTLDMAGNEMYLDTVTGLCYDVVTGEQVNPDTGEPQAIASPSPIPFLERGGDGGFAVPNGNGRGYCPSFGWAVNDTAHNGGAALAPGSPYYSHVLTGCMDNSTTPVSLRYGTYLSGVDIKIDATTGAIIDPWNCQPMLLATYKGTPHTPSSAFLDFFGTNIHSSSLANTDVWQSSHQVTISGTAYTLFYRPFDNTWYTWDGTYLQPYSIANPFTASGGDGGVSTLPPGAVGPQTGPLGSYSWPDPNNPALTPSGCPTSGPNIPARRIIYTPSDDVFPTTQKLSPKDNFMKGCNTYLSGINYWPLYEDEMGNIYITPQPAFRGALPVPDPNFIYRTGPDGRIQGGVVQKINDQNAIANRVVATSQNTKGDALVAVATNRSDHSFVSVQNIGRVILLQPILELNNITDIEVLRQAAIIALEFAALGNESIEATLLLNPFLNPHHVLSFNVYSKDGKTLEVSGTPNPFLMTSYDMDITTHMMKIVLGKLVAL